MLASVAELLKPQGRFPGEQWLISEGSMFGLMPAPKKRCPWGDDELMITYHDEEWGTPVHDDDLLFEHLVLDCMQAGLSWSTILHKREAFRRAFDGFDARKVARYDARKLDSLLQDKGIVRNRQKIGAAVNNAQRFLEVQREEGSFDSFLWGFVEGRTIHHSYSSFKQVPASSPESERMSAALRERGFKFVGPTICYAIMQAVGMVNDHLVECYRHRELLDHAPQPSHRSKMR
ncbi:MAG: DNA-3-methyladenine glycosylase I [Methanomassiliicoccales archaeon]|nr:DNA-3-methyladenine glycosylase I [Methanomassiliicoccales archaeon]MDD1756204.1 DNA-3-methyladenine glycosylase I [Methanomassiliicoccales archaeon]